MLVNGSWQGQAFHTSLSEALQLIASYCPRTSPNTALAEFCAVETVTISLWKSQEHSPIGDHLMMIFKAIPSLKTAAPPSSRDQDKPGPKRESSDPKVISRPLPGYFTRAVARLEL